MSIKFNILYLDDEESNLRIFRTAFKRYYKVYTASLVDKAFEILESNDIHLIISDQRMPQMTGVEFLTKTRVKYPDVGRMILTGFSDVKAIIDAINDGGVHRYITKPWEIGTLKEILDEACEQYQMQESKKDFVRSLQTDNEKLLAQVKSLQDKLSNKDTSKYHGVS
ncbi:response regulator [Flammeovirgaceae bacterium SG7u.111]|nr:response regulator [Flammeovirgaceae bacterium SG7u.132]WPO35233.1 response regulator [Flammeovirgaceae bacterium SG7u.111]